MNWKATLVILIWSVSVADGSSRIGPNFDLGIRDDAAYQAFRQALIKSEYVRVDYSLNPNPRAMAVVTALQVFATINPLASETDLQNFVNSYNDALESYSAGDPNLMRNSNLMAALRIHNRFEPPVALAGQDMRVGDAVIALLGIQISNPAGFETTRRRMVDFDNARIRSFANSPELVQIMVLSFYGQNLEGRLNPAIATLVESYLQSEGFEPVPDASPDDDRFELVDDAFVSMPTDYAAYVALLNEINSGATNLDATTLQDNIQSSFENIRAENTRLINEIAADMVDPPTLAESANNALDTAHVNQVLAEYEQNLLDVSGDRATVNWNAMILLQSDQAEAQSYATSASAFLDAQLQTDDTLAKVKSGIEIASGLATLGVGIASKEPSDVIAGLTDTILSSLDLADAFGAFGSPPPPEEQIFEQIVELRMDIDNVRVQMHDRFDRVEEQLDLIFVTMTNSFAAMGNQIGGLQDSVSNLSRTMAVQRATLDRLEDALWGVAADILLHDLTLQTDLVLNYRSSGLDLPYGTSSPNFVETASNLSTWAITTSAAETFAGPTTTNLTSSDTALAVLSGNSIGRNVNDLRVFPATLGLPVLFSDRVVAAAPWTQSASAYVQLAKESPWYFAYLYANQSDGGTADLDDIISKGEDLVSMMESGHDDELFDVLLDGYQQSIEELQSRENAIIQGVRSGTNYDVDPFGGLSQPQVAQNLPRVPLLNGVGASSDDLEMPADSATSWKIFFTGENAPDIAALSKALVTQAAHEEGINATADYEWNMNLFSPPNNNEVLFNMTCRVDGSGGGTHPELLASTTRQLRLRFTSHGSPVLFGNESQAEETFGQDLIFWRTIRNYLVSGQNLTGQSIVEFNGNEDLVTIDVVYDAHWQGNVTGRTVVLDQLDQLQFEVWDTAMDDHTILHWSDQLLDWETLLDAYVTLSMPGLLEHSTVVRSALRGASTEDGLALAVDVPSHYLVNSLALDSATPIADRLIPSFELFSQAIQVGLENPVSGHGYVDWVLSELYDLKSNAFLLAVDDQYKVSEILIVDSHSGVLANDLDQEYRHVEVDSYTRPENGTLELETDGSFAFIPDEGFTGTTSFTYQSRASIFDEPTAVFTSEPATVVLYVQCPANLNGDEQGDLLDLTILVDCLSAPGELLSFGCESADLDDDGDADMVDFAKLQRTFGCQ